MTTPKFLKKRWIRILITILILLVCLSTTVYYLTLPPETVLYFWGKPLTNENSRTAIILITNFIGLIAGILVNIFSGDIHETLKEERSEEINQPQIIVPPIENKIYLTSQPEIKNHETIQPVNSKFYPNNFIPDLKFFVGREKLLKDLEKKLAKEHRASFHDISGLGKTYTTYKFAEVYQNNYEKIFFVRANKEEMLQSLADMGILLNPLLKDEADQSKQAAGFKNWLEENEKWLVIYDNVDIPNELKPFVPTNKKGDCLFTSNFKSIANLADEIKIEKLAKTDARQLLFNRANNKIHSKIIISDDNERKAFEKIIEEIDGHPLSLNTTGAFISENVITFAEFERKLQKTSNFVLENEDGFDNYQRKSVLKAFTIAINDISARKANDKFENSAELAQKLLFAISFIAPDNIPEVLLQKTLQKFAEIDFESEENEDLWQEIRRKLLAYDLLKFNIWAKLFNTHRLIQKVIQSHQAKIKQNEIIPNIIIALDELFPFARYNTRETCEIYAPHAVVIIEKVEKIDLLSKETASIYAKVGLYFLETVKYEEAKRFLKIAINLDNRVSGKESLIISTYKDRLAHVYELQGNFAKAEEFYQEALEIDEKTIGKKHPDYAIALNNLANVYRSQDKNDEAIELYKQAILIDEKTIGNEHPEYAIRLDNLGEVYRKKRMFQESLDLHTEAKKIFENTYGENHPDYATCLNNLALVYFSQNNYEEAIKLYTQAIEISEKTIGKEHPHYAVRLSNLAKVYENQGKYSDALTLFEKALSIYVMVLPENHPHTQHNRQSIDRCQKFLGQEKEQGIEI